MSDMAVIQEALSVKMSYHTEVIISELSYICDPPIIINNLYRWLLFISAIQTNFFLGEIMNNNERS